ncbi:hypothetical protein A2U01_0072343 [Trifolium medium]|uniref:Uncharacterized protein n=1 Tax=Trifolium medium TaxID=97028 RepID=A0A392SQY7_9FABA|nr:hypothetical protein [Trifolium medium]
MLSRTPELQLSILDQMVVVVNLSSRRCCSCKPSSLTRTENTVCAAGCDEDDVADVMLPQTLIFMQPCRVYPTVSPIMHRE